MPIQMLELETTSIVILYEQIDDGEISRDRLRSMISGESPRLIDMPGGPLIVHYEELPGTNCIVNERRIHLSQAGTVEPGQGNLAEMATAAGEAIGDATMVAYGLNFNVRGSIRDIDSIGQFLRDRFLRHREHLEMAVGGQISWMFPRLEYVIADVRYQLRIDPDPSDEAVFKAHLNVHHATESLPGVSELSLGLREGFEYLGRVLDEVLSTE